MGIWQKTLFYLGLVDEDDPNSYADAGIGYGDAPMAQRAPQRRDPGAAPTARRTPPPDMGQQDRPDVAVRRTPSRRVEGTGPMEQDRDPLMTSSRVQGRRVEPPMTRRRPTSADSALAEAGVVVRPADTPLVRTVSDAELESEVIVATSYSDAQLLADHIRSTIPVVLDLRRVEPAMVRRLVDFASGLTYALGGTMRKIGQGVILVTPQNVNLSRDERRRLRELGYYQAPDES
jgi:cell division inhibitor SepF